MAEIVPVVSEALEAQVRALLPSQRGFGQDLQASNVITPIIDLTAAAQGTITPELLQTAIAFGSNTSETAQNNTKAGPSSPGFWRITGNANVFSVNSGISVAITMTDGLSTKTIYNFTINSNSTTAVNQSDTFDFVIFLRAGDSVSMVSNSVRGIGIMTYRQIADVNGNVVQPVGFTPQ